MFGICVIYMQMFRPSICVIYMQNLKIGSCMDDGNSVKKYFCLFLELMYLIF